MEKNEMKLIKGLKPAISVPICVTFGFIFVTIGIVFDLFDWESKRILIFFLVCCFGILSIISWANYITGYINYLDARKKTKSILKKKGTATNYCEKVRF